MSFVYIPVPFGGGGVGRAAFGVGADDDECALISGICCSFVLSHVGPSTSIAPSVAEIAGCIVCTGGDGCDCGGGAKVGAAIGGGGER